MALMLEVTLIALASRPVTDRMAMDQMEETTQVMVDESAVNIFIEPGR